MSSFSYLGIDFSSNGVWDMHIKSYKIMAGKKSISCIKLLFEYTRTVVVVCN